MDSYLVVSHAHGPACAREARDPVERLLAAGFSRVAISDVASIFVGTGTRWQQHRPGLITIGRRFGRGEAEGRLEGFLDAAGSRTLYEHGWGDFVTAEISGDTVRVGRAPLGRLGCYVVTAPTGVAIASDIATLRIAGIDLDEIAWGPLLSQIAHPHFRPRETALAGLSEIIGGEEIVFSGRETYRSIFWSPWNAALAAPRPTPAAAIAKVRDAVLSVVDAHARSANKILLGVSGGLDSSIIAVCLKLLGHDFEMFTQVTPDPRGDERGFARHLSDALDVPLHEAAERPDAVDITRTTSAHLPRPVSRAFSQSGDAISLELAARIGADTLFTGGAGDSIFCYLPSAAPIADALRAATPRRAVRTAIEVAMMSGVGLPTALRMGFRRAFLRPTAFRWPTDTRFLSRDAVEGLAGVVEHPWLEVPPGGLPGTAEHIAYLIGIENHLEGFDREKSLPLVAPLMAQPLAETCLAIPSWMWCRGGINRSVARDAFRSELPPVIYRRTIKGTPDGFAALLFDRFRAEIGPMLLEGYLASQALLDRAAIDRMLSDPRPLRGSDYLRLLALCDAEAWLAAHFRRDLKVLAP